MSAALSGLRSRRTSRSAMLVGIVGLLALPTMAVAEGEAALAERLTRIERTLSSSGLIELVKQVEALQEEVRQLRGELENHSFALEQVRKSQSQAYLDADARLGALEQGRAGVGGVPSEPPLSTLDSPANVLVGGTPSDQTMAVAIENPLVGPNLAPPQLGAALGPAIPPDRFAPLPNQSDAPNDPAISAPPGTASQVPPGTMSIVPAEAAAAPAMTNIVLPNEAVVPSLAPAGPHHDSAESDAAYRDAFGMLKAGQYEPSIAAFNQFLQQYPLSQNADNAQYWLGEAYYVMAQYEPAILQYQKLIESYPDSQKQSHAMLKIGYSYDELGLVEQSAAVLNQLKLKFPDTAAARLADERLQRLRAKLP